MARGRMVYHCTMMRYIGIALLLPVTALWCGCASLGDARRQDDMREQAELDKLRVTVARLQEQVQGLQQGHQDLYTHVKSVEDAARTVETKLERELAEIERSLKAMASSQEAVRAQMVADLSAKMANIMRSASVSSGSRVEEGYEHVVQPGETLSEIASAYNARIETIVKANGLANPNAIKVGQKLFIPE